MSVLSRNSILKAVESRSLGIKPFSPQALQPASYDMGLHWKILVSPTRYAIGQEIDLRKEPRKTYAVEPGRFIGVLTKEVLVMPLWIAARFGLRSEFTRHGLVAFGGIQVDPGYKGRLAISLFNAGPEPVEMVMARPMFTVEFNTLDLPVEQGYEGIFQNLRDFHPVQRNFILKAHTVSFSDIISFPGELAGLERRIAQHENQHRFGQPPQAIADLARSQGVEPLQNLADLADNWPETEDVNDFLTAVRTWRGRA